MIFSSENIMIFDIFKIPTFIIYYYLLTFLIHAYLRPVIHYPEPETGTNKNLAIANRSRVNCAHNTLKALIGLNITP